MSRLNVLPCAGNCGATVRRSGRWGSCKDCAALAYAYRERVAADLGPDAWVRAGNAVFGDRDEFARVVAAERAALARVA